MHNNKKLYPKSAKGATFFTEMTEENRALFKRAIEEGLSAKIEKRIRETEDINLPRARQNHGQRKRHG